MSAWRYYWRLVVTAFEPSWRISDLLASGLGLLLPLIAHWYPTWKLSNDLPWEIPLAVLLPAFVVRLVLAPYQLDRERQTEISALDEQVRTLTRAAPDLEVFFKKEHPMWWESQRWCRVGVRNRSTTGTARSVKLSVKQMQPNLLPFNALPSRLGEKGADNVQECRIGPRAETFFDVVKWAGSNSDTFTLWILEGESGPGQPFNLPVGATCELTLELTAEEITPRQVIVRLARC